MVTQKRTNVAGAQVNQGTPGGNGTLPELNTALAAAVSTSNHTAARAVALHVTLLRAIAVIVRRSKNGSQSGCQTGTKAQFPLNRSPGVQREMKGTGVTPAAPYSLAGATLRINMSIILQGFTTILAADFVSGFVHWAEDACARQDPPVTGKLSVWKSFECINEMVFGLKRRADPTVKSAGV